MNEWIVNPYKILNIDDMNNGNGGYEMAIANDGHTNTVLLKQDIKANGLKSLVIVDEEFNTLISGFSYVVACYELGIKNIPVIVVDLLKVPDKIEDYSILDNAQKNRMDKEYNLIETAYRFAELKDKFEHGTLKNILNLIKVSHSEYDRYIKISKVYQKEKLPDNLPLNKTYEIALIPERYRFQRHKVNGFEKLPQDMTIRELREVKRKYKLKS
ncbi:hypothetical protein [Staphylococcus hominis]|uniref:hypothetical protein n=1 Tax=Staphylococcus hominis TaxID=1290 RepID=UPI001F596210|nr:hypothetical protein [Staphylococcus hominis]MCI2863571.1 hypothetical protein [Staphylococcus hominis]MCI2868003.1 hypothetical protein [Staphylococcus hominis]MCI2885370.1 hypothetical protein [Staphylococcus hominis]